jgi:arylsulfatase A-like enzyme
MTSRRDIVTRTLTTWMGRRPASAGSPLRSRREFLGIAAATVGALGLLGACGGGTSRTPVVTAGPAIRTPAVASSSVAAKATPTQVSPPRTSVLLVTIDTLRADQLRSYGQKLVQTPTLDAFAAQGARFAWHMVHQPQTLPSHGSILTGMYPSSDGVRVQLVDKLSPTLDTAGTAFARQGYSTAALFSCSVFDPKNCGFQRGFDVYKDLSFGLTASQPGEMLKSSADRTTDAAIAQLHAFGDQPFFLWLHYIDPHCPYVPPAPYATRYDPNYHGTLNGGWTTVTEILTEKLRPKGADLERLKSLYQGEISYVDSQIGRVFAELDQLDRAQATVVAVTADHGESFAEHRDFFTGEGIYHPRSLYNTELHVPLMLRYPPRIRPGTVVSSLTRAIDILPTLLELSDQPALPQVQGKSLTPLLEGGKDDSPRAVYSAMGNSIFTSVASEGWKLIQNNATKQQHLFDLAKDPAEMDDVLPANRAIAAHLSAQLATWSLEERIF